MMRGESQIVLDIVLGIVGVIVAIAGIYYLVAEKNDDDSRKIHLATVIGGLILVIYAVCQWVFSE